MVINVIYLAVSDSLLSNLSPTLLVLTERQSEFRIEWEQGYLAWLRAPVHTPVLCSQSSWTGQGDKTEEGAVPKPQPFYPTSSYFGGQGLFSLNPSHALVSPGEACLR